MSVAEGSTNGHAQALLRRWLQALDQATDGLTRLPVQFAEHVSWWRQTTRTLDGREFHSTFCSRALTAPAASVAVVLTADGDRLRWSRSRKCWDTAWCFHSSAGENADNSCSLISGTDKPWWQGDPWVKPIEASAELVWCLPDGDRSTTGRWLPLCTTQHGRRLTACLFVAKDDTKFRRLGHWGLRGKRVAAMPVDLMPLLSRGWSGELQLA